MGRRHSDPEESEKQCWSAEETWIKIIIPFFPEARPT